MGGGDIYKERGNVHFRNQEYAEAIAEYSMAILKDPSNPIYYTNRAMCHHKLGNYEATLADGEKALSLDINSCEYIFTWRKR